MMTHNQSLEIITASLEKLMYSSGVGILSDEEKGLTWLALHTIRNNSFSEPPARPAGESESPDDVSTKKGSSNG